MSAATAEWRLAAIHRLGRDPSRSRYGAVFLLTLALLVFVIVGVLWAVSGKIVVDLGA